MRIFLSHISEEASEARALKLSLEEALPGLEVFVSAADIHLGDRWLGEIEEALENTNTVLALCSPNSVRRPWLNFETGSGWGRQLHVIPICYREMRKDDLPDPLHVLQAIELSDENSCKNLVQQLANFTGVAIATTFDPISILESLKSKLATRRSEIAIILSHRQGEWEPGGRTVFEIPNSLPASMRGTWRFCKFPDKREFLSTNLHTISGMILASPWRAKMEPETISAVAEWVRMGGRLLLLGFELGDRHHDANLAELSHRFGIDPSSDIVGPPSFGDRKPYDERVSYDASKGDDHPFTQGLSTLQFTNMQTLRVEPGGTEWLRVGGNPSYRPKRETVKYRNGTMTTPGDVSFENREAEWLPVAVEAPAGLCGKGAVHMIGTWDLIGRAEEFGEANFTLLARLLDWLSDTARVR